MVWNTHCKSASGEDELLLSVKVGEEPAKETLPYGSSVWTTNQWWRGQSSFKIEIISNN